MSKTPTADRIEGKVEEIGGTIKKHVGLLIGNEQMELEGKMHEIKGQAVQEAAKAEQRTKGKVEELTGNLKSKVGDVIDNEQMQVEGKLKELKGKARQQANK